MYYAIYILKNGKLQMQFQENAHTSGTNRLAPCPHKTIAGYSTSLIGKAVVATVVKTGFD